MMPGPNYCISLELNLIIAYWADKIASAYLKITQLSFLCFGRQLANLVQSLWLPFEEALFLLIFGSYEAVLVYTNTT